MPLDVVGAGLGRTGTLSLKLALERLGFVRCYHMAEVLANPGHESLWLDALEGGDPYDTVFDGYSAAVDWPACAFWRELADKYPSAKVLLSVRPPEKWFASFHDTIYQVLTRDRAGIPADYHAMIDMASQVARRSLGGDVGSMGDDEIVAAYEAHNAAVEAAFGPDRLLTFDVVQGWEPLCAFLGVDVPDEEFPNVNDREMFRQVFLGESS